MNEDKHYQSTMACRARNRIKQDKLTIGKHYHIKDFQDFSFFGLQFIVGSPRTACAVANGTGFHIRKWYKYT